MEWLETNGFRVSPELRPPVAQGKCKVDFQIPVEARTQRLLARDLTSWLGNYGAVLFWLADWRFAKADELAIAGGLRAAQGERRSLADAPGQLFEFSEKDHLAAWLGLTMSFGWEASLCLIPQQLETLSITREEFICVAANETDRIAEARKFALRYEMDIYREVGVDEVGIDHADLENSP